jgi:hypothetical protein
MNEGAIGVSRLNARRGSEQVPVDEFAVIGSGLQCRGEKRDPVLDLLTSSAFIRPWPPYFPKPQFCSILFQEIQVGREFAAASRRSGGLS